jgi:hypothetical protein
MVIPQLLDQVSYPCKVSSKVFLFTLDFCIMFKFRGVAGSRSGASGAVAPGSRFEGTANWVVKRIF